MPVGHPHTHMYIHREREREREREIKRREEYILIKELYQ
jgi:hypothetical protein